MNGARSAFASFIFQRSFFHSYRNVRRATGRDLEDDENEEEPLKCKISIKVHIVIEITSVWFSHLVWTLSLPLQSCVSVFKALSTLEKTVDRCSFYLDSRHTKLVFVFHCRHGEDNLQCLLLPTSHSLIIAMFHCMCRYSEDT